MSLGIELGSTRIKGVLIDSKGSALASGEFDWENQLVDGIWTYDLDTVWSGIQSVYSQIKASILQQYDIKITNLGSIGFSAMMHGYLAFDKADTLLVPFRTWRNVMTEAAEKELTALFNHNIPQRWSIAHLYQAILNEESHVHDVAFFTTLAGYVHWQLTGEKVLGVGDASGMFPIDVETKDYDSNMIDQFNTLIQSKGVNLDLNDILPKSLLAGTDAGKLTDEGALLLDPTGDLKAGVIFAPPEGDAGTGMVATHAILPNTGNVSAGTSVFAMIVLDDKLQKVYPEIDIVTTPLGDGVAMVHVNNCTSEINAWANVFGDFAKRMGLEFTQGQLFETLFNAALESDDGLEGILSYGYHSGENITQISEGRPLLVRKPDANFTFANFMRSHIDSAFATLHIGMQILFDEDVRVDSIVGHGGIFKTKGVAQHIVANAVESPVTLMDTASEGGAWGMALLSQYMLKSASQTLHAYLDNEVFKGVETISYTPHEKDIETYREYVKRYEKGLEIEKEAIKSFS